jgi:RNA polymerase sigma-B factor
MTTSAGETGAVIAISYNRLTKIDGHPQVKGDRQHSIQQTIPANRQSGESTRKRERSQDVRFVELGALPPGSVAHRELRERLITDYTPIARHVAGRYAHRGEPREDLDQVAVLGLINAVDRFLPERGCVFLSFAIPTIRGEIRRYFRDLSWAVRVPRRLKDLQLPIRSASEEITQRNGRTPLPCEIASQLGVGPHDVEEGIAAGSAYRTDSLDRPISEGTGMTIVDTLAEQDSRLSLVEDRESVIPLLAKLPDRERTILVLRFFLNMSQAVIADRVGTSQMHVSRLLTQTLNRLRDQVRDE